MNSNSDRQRRSARDWLAERGLELWIITGIWALVTLAIYLLAVGHESPRRYQDEFLFWALAKNFAGGDGLTWRGVSLGMKSWLYPVMLAPAFWIADSVPGQYTLVHLINSMMISAAIFPGYLLARLIVNRWQATVVALLVVAVPAMNYAGVIGTENLGYPVFIAACGAILLALARPSPRHAVLAFATIIVAVLTRTQFVILFPVFVAALLLAAVMQENGRRVDYLRERRANWAGMLAFGLLGGLALIGQGKHVFGLYAGAFDGVALTRDVTWFWVKAFAADVYLLTGIIPVIATFAMFGRAENRRDPVIGALLALSLVAAIALVAQISWFSATNQYDWRGRHIFYERYMFYLGPLFFAGMVASFKRVGVAGAVVSAAIATVIVSGFQTDAVLVPFSYDSFGLSLVGRHMESHPGAVAEIGMLLARVTFLLGLVYVVSTAVRGRARAALHWGLVAFTAIVLVASQAQSWHYARKYSKEAFAVVPLPATFIDTNTTQPVGMIITSTDDPLSYFTTEFWNRRVVRAFASDAAPIQTPIMYSPKCDFSWKSDGEITGCDLVPSAWYLRSDRVVMHLKDEFKRVNPGSAWPTVTLMVGRAPARIRSLTDGRQVRSGLVQGGMNVRSFLDGPGQLRLKLRGDASHSVVEAGGRSVLVGPGEQRTLTVKVPKGEFVTRLMVRTTGGIPSGVFVNSADLREGDGPWKTIL
jgi:hypothetical protein